MRSFTQAAILFAMYTSWCGACWLLRGGKFGSVIRRLFEVEPGTTITRLCCAVLMATPLAFIDPVYAGLAGSIFAAMTIGYFRESMGLTKPYDWLWLALWGAVVATSMVLPIAIFKSSLVPLACGAAGSFVTLGYYVNKPLGRHWGLDWTERAEICAGLVFGSIIWGALWL